MVKSIYIRKDKKSVKRLLSDFDTIINNQHTNFWHCKTINTIPRWGSLTGHYGFNPLIMIFLHFLLMNFDK